MTTKADFSDEEWTRLKRAPFVAGMAITLADPGGPIEAFKETKATLQTVTDAIGGDRGPLVQAIAGEVSAEARQRHSPLAGFKPTRGATAGVEILEELAAVNEILRERTTPDEAAAVREWLISAAQQAANAAKEGGFLGFNAERISTGEQDMLNRLNETLSA
jgi:hypothetical protein